MVSKYNKQEIMNLGFRHTEAKCLLQYMIRFFPFLLKYEITPLTIFCMHDRLFAKQCMSYKYNRCVKYYTPVFYKVSHKTKKILSKWMEKNHPYNDVEDYNICKCKLCKMHFLLYKFSEYDVHSNGYNILTFSHAHISLMMYMYFYCTTKYSYMGDEYRFYLILFKIANFDKNVTMNHREHFYCKIEEYYNTKRKLKLFDELVKTNYDLPEELIINIHSIVLGS
jgi:hypothetical protein